MFELPFAFSTPAVLLAMAALPALWVLLRVTPPQPRRIDFPPLRLILDLVPKQETPARTPWWLLLLRLVIAGLVVLRRQRVMVWPLVSMLAMVTLTAVAVYGHIRFRTVGDLVVIVGAAVSIDALLPGRRGANAPPEPAPAVLVAPAEIA